MELFSVVPALFPLLLIFYLLLFRKTPADCAGLAGLGAALAVSCLYFGTPWRVAFAAVVSGVVGSLPVGIAMGASVFQVTVMAEAGALSRIVAFIKRIAPEDKAVQVLLINCGIGILFTAFGAVTISIFPPILLALGYSAFAAIALPCIGYTGGCIYAIMGVPVLIFAHQAGVDLNTAGLLFAEYLPLMLLLVSWACLWFAGKRDMMVSGFVPALAASIVAGFAAVPLALYGFVTLTGIAVGGLYVLVLLAVLFLRKKPVLASAQEALPPGGLSLAASLSPWILLIVCSLITNTPFFPVFDYLFNTLAMPVEIIPGRPDRLRIFWQSYFWIPLCTVACLPFLKMSRAAFAAALKKTAARAPRPVLALACYFAVASLYVYSGFSAEWVPPASTGNMIGVLSNAAAGLFGSAYVAAAPFLGLLGGIIGGSQSSSVAMLTKLHLGVGGHLGISGPMLALLSALGGGLSGAVSPAKVMNAAAAIDRVGEEGAVLRSVLGVVLLAAAATALAGWLLRG